MKKLLTVCAACMVASMVTAQGVESQNIVGYNTIDIPQGSSIIAPSFTTVGGDATELTLGMITPGASFDAEDISGGGTIQFINSDGSWGIKANYWGGYDGWYDAADGETVLNDAVLPKGGGFYVYAYVPSTFMCAGEITLATFDVVIPAGSSQLGNAIPVDLTLGDLTPSASFDAEDTSGGGTIQLINADGTWGIKANYWGAYDGWYDASDGETVLNAMPLSAGSGFYVFAYTEATVSFPAIVTSN